MSDENSALANERSGEVVGEQANIAELGFLEIAIALARRKKFVLGVPFVAAVIASVVVVTMPNVYTATTRLLPPQQTASAASALLSQLSGALGGLAGGIAGKGTSDVYIGMLKSRTVADRLIARFDLAKVYGQELASGTRRSLEGRTAIVMGKDGIISIDVDDTEPKRAAEIANAYVEELTNLTKVLAVTEASQRRLFFETQLAQAKEKMTAAEMAAKQGLEKGGITKLDDQGRAMVEITARLRAQISVKEVQIGSLRTFASDQNPELVRAQQELDALRRELSRAEGASSGLPGVSGSTGGRNAGLENFERLRDMKYYETVYELLARQYELARLDEAKDGSIIQVVDRAIEPDQKSKPKRTQIVLLTATGVWLLVVFFILIGEYSVRARSDPARVDRLKVLRSYLQWRSGA